MTRPTGARRSCCRSAAVSAHRMRIPEGIGAVEVASGPARRFSGQLTPPVLCTPRLRRSDGLLRRSDVATRWSAAEEFEVAAAQVVGSWVGDWAGQIRIVHAQRPERNKSRICSSSSFGSRLGVAGAARLAATFRCGSRNAAWNSNGWARQARIVSRATPSVSGEQVEQGGGGQPVSRRR